MARPMWFVNLLSKVFPSRFWIAKLTKFPIIGKVVVKLLDKLLFEGSDIVYLPKDQVVQVNQVVKRSGEVVLPSRIVEHFIKIANHHWIMDFCLCRRSEKCEHYPIDLGCLFLGEAALGINPQLGRRVTKEEALEHVKKCREAGLIHIIGRDKLDTAWLNVGPGEKLLTVCNCCECCCLWRILPHLAPELGNSFRKIPSVRVRVTERCVGCGTCSKGVCFIDAIHLINKKAIIKNTCRGCGRCVDICPQNAIEISITDDRFVERTIEHISAKVDLS
ncbi:MAG: 4Fe-4S binding protein [Candidatus Helarchaeota archaeon]|nr:4Fe-4S binding protein [Candidatus Helarchaeota archaeon]